MRLRAHVSMHEWPLVVFTALAIPSAGMVAARPLGPAPNPWTPADGYTAAALLFLAVGLAVSLTHLGRPLRAPLALPRAGRNALGTEVLLAILVLALSGLTLLPAVGASSRLVLAWAAGACAALLLGVIGLVYFLRGQRPWRTSVVAAPLTLGLAFGMSSLAIKAPPGPDLQFGSYAGYLVGVLLLDAIVAGTAWIRHLTASTGFLPAHPAIFAQRRTLIALRLLMVNVVPAALVLAGTPFAAVVVLFGGVCVDRFAFYGTVCAQTTEAEIARVEEFIAESPPA